MERSVLEPFLKSGLIFAILQLLGNELSLTERFQILEIGLAKISAPSFRNLPDNLSMPTAFDRFRLNIFPEIFQKI